MNIEIKKSLSILELGDLARIIEMQEKDIKFVDMSYEKRLEMLLETLIQERENRLINRLIRNAYFKYPSASLESLDYDSRQMIMTASVEIKLTEAVLLYLVSG